jgi:uncharacterized protein YqgC (DUF456 family)
MSLLTVLVFGLLGAGLVTSILPRVPGGPTLSLVGVSLHWWATDYSEPGIALLGLITVLVVLERLSGLITPVLAAKVGGTSPVTATIASLVGAVLFFFTGTLGFVLGLALSAFVLEFLRRRDVRASVAAAVVVVLSTFATKAVKILVAGFILVVMVGVVFL